MLVNFWASWCGPCRAESPALEEFHRSRRQGGDFTVLGIDTRDLSVDAREFVGELGLSYPHFRDPEGDAADEWGTTGVPESFLVDPHGEVRLLRRGPVDREYLSRFVAPLIAGPSTLMRAAVATTIGALLLGWCTLALAAEPRASLPDLEDEVMCPICGTLLELSEAPQAQRQRVFIRDLIADGRDKEQIKAALVAEYGQEVLALPDDEGFQLAAYLVPIAAFVVAAIALAFGVRRWRRTGAGAAAQRRGAAPPADERLDADMRRYDL